MTPSLARVGGLSAAFVGLGVLVATGVCTPLDQYATHHLMLGLYPYVGGGSALTVGAHTMLGPISSSTNPGRIVNRIADTAYIPAGVVVASLLVCACAAVALMCGRRIADVAGWIAAYVAGNSLELIGKVLVARPALHTTALYGSVHVRKFDTSFPSGHAIRAVLLAAFVSWAVGPLRPVAVAWASVVVVLLVLAGTHTPTDVLGGLLAAGALILGRRAASAPRVGARLERCARGRQIGGAPARWPGGGSGVVGVLHRGVRTRACAHRVGRRGSFARARRRSARAGRAETAVRACRPGLERRR